MTNTNALGENHSVQSIRDDLSCPSCGYSLRGLPGDVVTCPECGERCDVAMLVTARWTEAWWKAPGFQWAIAPASMFFVALLIGLVLWHMIHSHVLPAWPLPLILVGMAFAWFYFMYRSWQLFDHLQGFWLACLAHVLIIAMFLAAIGSLISVILLATEVLVSGTRSAANAGLSLISLLLCIAVFYSGRKGEKFIASQCIRQHLRERMRQHFAIQRRAVD